ncbi:Multidrug resistance protein Stp [Mycobacterium simulans]|uniref:DHA2 family efflux MFS transporter permease subunit n=1 Tax=Mycobacterium simulans TaxID=627089 RepID=UPI0019CB608D|nr:DHA2 family efflux MFS transporter permease subunit [Mycobacterium simulans]SON63734.1 Multidrug resistance protein Stp [Mycobacterium simulans]
MGRPRTPRLTLIAVCLAVFMLLLDMTIVSAALANIQASLDAELSGLQWVVDAYALPMAGLLLTAATLGDRLGRRRLFLAGMTVFTLASAGCALAGSIEVLNACRALQGAGGAVLLGVSLPIVAAAYPEQRGRGVAIAIYGGVMGAGAAVGPLLGGALVGAFGWQSIFLINVPIGLVALAIAVWFVPESRAPQDRPLDLVGTAVLTAALFAGTYVLIEGNHRGWTSPLIVGLSVFCVLSLLLFGSWEARVSAPMLDLRVVRRPGFAGVSLAAFAAAGTLIASTNYLALYFMNTLGYSPFQAGLRALPLTIACVLGAPLAMTAAPHFPAWMSIPGGAVLIAVGLWLMTGVTENTQWTHFIGGSIVAGLGLGGLFALTSDIALQFVPVADAGMATGTVSTIRQVGILAGVAGLGALFSRHAANGAADGLAKLHGVAPGPVRQLADRLSAGAGLRVLEFLPDDVRPALPAIARVARQASADGMQAALVAAAFAATVAAVGAAILIGVGGHRQRVVSE